jgi:cytidyltransferase-like protein
MIFYADMVGDLLHYGHIKYIKAIYEHKTNENDKIYIGVHDDETVESYKRTPILTMDERIKMLEGVKYIDKIIPHAPLKITNDFIKLHNIEKFFTADNRTKEDDELMLSEIKDNPDIEIIRIKYTSEISTTGIINRIKKYLEKS